MVIMTIMMTFYFNYFIKFIAEICGCGSTVTNPTGLHTNTSGQTITQVVNKLPVQPNYLNRLFRGKNLKCT